MKKSPSELLQDLIVDRMKKQYYEEFLRCKLLFVIETNENHLVVWQDMEEIDPNWDSWNLWIITFLQLLDEGLLDANDFKTIGLDGKPIPTHSLPETQTHEQLSELRMSNSNIKCIVFEDINYHLRINLDLLGAHFAKTRLTKISLDLDPQWEPRRGLNPQLVSGLNLNENQATQLEKQFRIKLKEVFPNIDFPESAIKVQASSMRGVFRVLINLKDVWNLCYKDILPSPVAPSNTNAQEQDEHQDLEHEDQRMSRLAF